MSIFFGSADALRSMEISRAVKAGKMRKLAPKIYTDDLKATPEESSDAIVWKSLRIFIPVR